MKKTLKKIAIIFLSAVLFASCANSSDDPTAPANDTSAEASNTEVKVEEGLNVPLTSANFAAWDSERASFQNNVLSLNTNNKDGGAGNGASFWFEPNQNAGDYKYAKFSYESLDVPNVNLRLKYSDGSYSEVYLQSHLNEVYIELDASKKTAIKEINLMTRQSQSQIGAEKSTFTVKGLSFVKEKKLPQKAALVDAKTGSFNDSISALEISEKIGFGFSLGCGLNRCPFYKDDKRTPYAGYGFQNNYDKDNNPLVMNIEGQSSALGYQTGGMALELDDNPLVTKAFFDAIKAKGFTSIRICVTWFPHIIEKDTYKIDPVFMARVKEVVDWAISDGFYVLLNEHHSVHDYCVSPKYGDGYNLDGSQQSKAYLEAIYRQICAAFNGSYDERLIFEILNEPRLIRNDGKNGSWDIWAENLLNAVEKESATKALTEYSKSIIKIIRESGGNNAKRFIMVAPYATDWRMVTQDYLNYFDFDALKQADTASNKLMVAIHWYPMGFNGDKETSARKNYGSDVTKNNFEGVFKSAYDNFISKGVPVCITEFGIENNADFVDYKRFWGNQIESDRQTRLTCLSDFCEVAGKYGLSLMAWDDGGVHTVVKRFSPFEAYDGESFISTLINKYKTARSQNIFLTPSQTDLPSSGSDWGSADVDVTGVAEGNVIKLGLSKIAGASYSQIRICPKGDSWISLAMNSISVENNAAELENADPATDGKNITVNADRAIVSYTLTSDDCSKINSGGGIALRGFGVKITSVSLIK
ncbi:MAG: cellulase family glycosylhydrolase [Treponema sp.]|nr:cellulase family glycosylhydrolase [Treponema sp.]